MDILNEILVYLRAGFAEVNALQGLIIALVAALLLPDWRRIPAFAIASSAVHILVDTLLPVLAYNAPVRLPDIMRTAFWENVVVLLLGYLVVISLFAGLKRLVFKR